MVEVFLLRPGFTSASCLSAAERDAVARLRRPADRARAVAGRGGARVVLGSLLGVPPAAVPIEPDGSGKPRLTDGAWDFSVSHSGEVVLVAVTDADAVGVDVERVDPDLDCTQLAPLLYHPGEPRTRPLEVWTRKEAVLKARGVGLRVAPSSFAVLGADGSFIPEVDGYRMWPLDVGAGYVAALAVAPAARAPSGSVPVRRGELTLPAVAR